MPIGILFWVIYVVAAIVYFILNWPLNRVSGSVLVLFILIFLLGWHDFGFVVQN